MQRVCDEDKKQLLKLFYKAASQLLFAALWLVVLSMECHDSRELIKFYSICDDDHPWYRGTVTQTWHKLKKAVWEKIKQPTLNKNSSCSEPRLLLQTTVSLRQPSQLNSLLSQLVLAALWLVVLSMEYRNSVDRDTLAPRRLSWG